MIDKEYPVHMKKRVGEQIETRYVANKEEEAKHAEIGFVSDPRQFPTADFPCLMYRSDGSYVHCQSASQKASLLDQGYSPTPVVKQVHVAADPIAASTNRIDALESSVAELRDGMKTILDALNSRKGR